MADLAEAWPLDAVFVPGRYGASGPAGVTVAGRRGVAATGVIARAGQGAAVAEAVRAAFGLALPETPRRVATGAVEAIWAGPGRWLLLGPGEHAVAAAIGDRAAITDLTDARVLLRLSGPRARDVLAKGVPLDLHPRVFAPGDAALTMAALIPVHLWQVDEAPTFDIAVARSLAGSLFDWLRDAAAEYGLDIAA